MPTQKDIDQLRALQDFMCNEQEPTDEVMRMWEIVEARIIELQETIDEMK